MTRARVLASAVLLLGPAPLARADWVAAGFLGTAATQRATLRIEQPQNDTALDAEGVSFDGRSFDSPVYYGCRILWAGPSRERLGFEVEFIHLKVYADTVTPVAMLGTLRGFPVDGTRPLGNVVQHFSISHGLNLVFGNVAWRQPLGTTGAVSEARMIVAARAGAGATIPHGESAIDGRTQEQYEWGRVAGQLAAGLEWRIGRRAAAVAEYKVTGTAQRVSVSGGTVEGTFVSHHLVGGVALRF